MDLKWGVFFFKHKWFCWGRGSYRGQIQLDSNWLPCVVSCWSSRGYQNIMPGRVITMTSRVIKDIKSGRWVRREMRKASRAEGKKDSQEKKKMEGTGSERQENQYTSICSIENVPSCCSRQPIQGLQQPADKLNIYPQTHTHNMPPQSVPVSIYLRLLP